MENATSVAPVERLVRHHLRCKPGRGWKQHDVTTCVWDHESGIRLHLGGCLRLADGRFVDANIWPEACSVSLAVRMAGGSRKRGLMLWALLVARNGGPLAGVI